jgi:hypothetical protein
VLNSGWSEEKTDEWAKDDCFLRMEKKNVFRATVTRETMTDRKDGEPGCETHDVQPAAHEKKRVVYILCNSASRGKYVGWTNNATRRLRQHNGELVGGAGRTSGRRAKDCEKGNWSFAAHVCNFVSHFQARSFEAYMHLRRNRKVGRCRGKSPVETCLKKARRIIAAYPLKFGHLQVVEFKTVSDHGR